jgi:hypothetical protein
VSSVRAHAFAAGALAGYKAFWVLKGAVDNMCDCNFAAAAAAAADPVQTRGGQLTVQGVLQYIWQHEGFVGLFK